MSAQQLYAFHRSNIHERRPAAYLARCAPMAIILVVTAVSAYGYYEQISVLLWASAVLNVGLWLWVTSSGVHSILGADKVDKEIEAELQSAVRRSQDNAQGGDDGEVAVQEPVPAGPRAVHVIVLPNYREDESLLDVTLQSLREARGSESFRILLAMEAREGPGAAAKAARLQERFAGAFADLHATFHPADLEEVHMDGTSEPEVPGKASNLKWAVAQARERCAAANDVDLDQVVLTVADADVLFHPGYFLRVESEFLIFKRHHLHRWTMWQAPQLPYRNYYTAPAPSRVWGYLASTYEFGGVSSLPCGGHHMLFSAYSLSLELATAAELWDGDVLAEDHHAYLKAFFYSVHFSAQASLNAVSLARTKVAASIVGCRPALRVRAVMLPVKSTSVESCDGFWRSCVERWHQAKRHCQGVAEVSYALLACWDLLCSLPLGVYNFSFLSQLAQVVARPILMHLMPLCQTVALGIFSVYWVLHHQSVPACPDRIWFFNFNGQVLLCGLAGAFALTWPILIPFALTAIGNYRMLCSTFLKPANVLKGMSHWHDCDGEVPPTFGSQKLTVALLIFWDCAVLMTPIMVPYGLIANVVGAWSVMVRGNRCEYITAAKGISSSKDKAADYGTMACGEKA